MKFLTQIPSHILKDARFHFRLSDRNVKHVGTLAALILHKSAHSSDHLKRFVPLSKSYIEICTSGRFLKNKLRPELRHEVVTTSSDDHDKLFEVLTMFTRTTKTKRGVPQQYAIPTRYLLSKVWESFEIEIPDDRFLNNVFPDIIDHFKKTFSELTIDDRVFEHYHSLFDYSIISSANETNAQPRYKVARTIREFNYLAKNQWMKRSYSALLSLCPDVPSRTLPSTRHLIWWQKEYHSQLMGDIVLFEEEDHLVLAEKNHYLRLKKERSLSIMCAKLEALKAGRHYGVISKSNGRLSTNITQLNSPLLRYLKLEGQHLISFDLKSSQPTILLNLILGDPRLLGSISNSIYPNLRNSISKLKQLRSNDQGMRQMLDFVINEDIYELISENEGIHRSEAKVLFLRWLFGKGKKKFDYMSAIDKRFPTFRKHLVKAKGLFNSATHENGLALLLQSIEAHLFIESILGKLAAQNIPAITKHDSVLVADNPERRGQVFSAIEEVFKTTGFIGKISKPDALYLWEASDPRITKYGEDMYHAAPSIYHEMEKFVEAALTGEQLPWKPDPPPVLPT